MRNIHLFWLLPYVVLLGSISCSSSSSLKKILQNKPHLIDRWPASDEQEARNLIQNHQNFLKLVFQQSRDPYYGVPKWSEECLHANHIGEVEEFNKDVQSVSELYVDRKGNVGHCPENRDAVRVFAIEIFCEGHGEVVLLKFPYDPTLSLSSHDLCPELVPFVTQMSGK